MNPMASGCHRIVASGEHGGRCLNCDLNLTFVNSGDVIYLQTRTRCDRSGPREASSVPETALKGDPAANAAQTGHCGKREPHPSHWAGQVGGTDVWCGGHRPGQVKGCTCSYTSDGFRVPHPSCPVHGLNAVFKPPGDEGPLAPPV